jgi:hypothetical protein
MVKRDINQTINIKYLYIRKMLHGGNHIDR